MSLTIQQIISDAKRLAGRLKERDSIADMLLNETHGVNKTISAMKQFQEEVEMLNEVAHQKPHSQLIANIQRENRHLRELQQENRDLRTALEEHQTALEHIMSKYRQHTSDQIYKSRLDFNDFKFMQEKRCHDIIAKQAEKIKEMAAVMQKAAELDDTDSCTNTELISKLRTENKGLREIMEISTKYGTTDRINISTEDKNVQTDNTNS